MKTVTVNAKALFTVLSALNGPPEALRDLMVSRRSRGAASPIDILVTDYNLAVEEYTKATGGSCQLQD